MSATLAASSSHIAGMAALPDEPLPVKRSQQLPSASLLSNSSGSTLATPPSRRVLPSASTSPSNGGAPSPVTLSAMRKAQPSLLNNKIKKDSSAPSPSFLNAAAGIANGTAAAGTVSAVVRASASGGGASSSASGGVAPPVVSKAEEKRMQQQEWARRQQDEARLHQMRKVAIDETLTKAGHFVAPPSFHHNFVVPTIPLPEDQQQQQQTPSLASSSSTSTSTSTLQQQPLSSHITSSDDR